MTDHVHYLPADRDSGRWGLQLSGGGSALVRPGGIYPAPGHPDSHLFNWERGRVLGEFQLVVIASGGGDYEDRGGSRRLRAGHAFLLVPGQWHRYRPTPDTGWGERWLGFDGPVVRQLHGEGRLDPAAPAWNRPISAALRGRFEEILALLLHRPPAWRVEAEALLASILARIAIAVDAKDDPVRDAARRLETELHVPIEELAAATGLSPAQFRHRFHQLHGCSPRRYRQQALAARAQRLLAVPGVTLAEVANALGFSDHAHFTRGFRRACGEHPSGWRQRHAGPW